MNYLVIKDNTIVQICTSVEDLLVYLKVQITDDGIVQVGDTRLPASYNMKQWSKEEIIKDISKYQLKRIEGILQIGIYKLARV